MSLLGRLLRKPEVFPHQNEHRADKYARNRTPPPRPAVMGHDAIHTAFLKKWSGELRDLVDRSAPLIAKMAPSAGARTAWRDADRFVRGGYTLAQCPTPDAVEGWHRILSRRLAVGARR
jgi:hypothetical protein